MSGLTYGLKHFRYFDMFEKRSWSLCAKKGREDSYTDIEVIVTCPQCQEILIEWSNRNGWIVFSAEANVIREWHYVEWTYKDLNGQYLPAE